MTRTGSTAVPLSYERAPELFARFLAEVDAGADPQLVMARWTGNYRRGNERTAHEHPRNRSGERPRGRR
ncbi:hypothetical protein ACWEKM_44750 [Streptomyces sp. NPDC004752]